MTIAFTLGILWTLAGCTLLYSSTNHQKFLQQKLPARPSRILGVTFMLGGFLGFLVEMQAAAAIFTFSVWALLIFTLLPYLGALFQLTVKRANKS